MNDIQKARDVLAKWRADDDDPMPYWTEDQHFGFGDASARLIVGTAGNPELWDAIDELLAVGKAAESNPFAAGFLIRVQRIAAAILAADERMQQ